MKNKINEQLHLTENILNNINTKEAVDYATWTKDKAQIIFSNDIPKFPITTGFIYWCNLGINIGSEQNKIRPVIIIKNSKNSQICTILPLTSERMNDSRWYHVDLENINSTVLIEQLRNVSKLRFINPFRAKGKLVKISINDWNRINSALQKYYCLGILK